MLPEEQSLLAPTQPETFTVRDCANNCGPDIANTGTSTTATINIAGEMTAIETVQVKLKISFATANRAPAEHLKGTIAIALVHRNNQGTILSRSLLQKRHPYYQQTNLGGGPNQPTNQPIQLRMDLSKRPTLQRRLHRNLEPRNNRSHTRQRRNRNTRMATPIPRPHSLKKQPPPTPQHRPKIGGRGGKAERKPKQPHRTTKPRPKIGGRGGVCIRRP